MMRDCEIPMEEMIAERFQRVPPESQIFSRFLNRAVLR